MVIAMEFYTVSHGGFHDRRYSDILYEITRHWYHGMLSSRTLSNHNHMVITLSYFPDWVYFKFVIVLI